MTRVEFLEHRRALLARTEAELAMTPDAWEVKFGARHPGAGYNELMRAQVRRCRKEIAAVEAAIARGET